MATIAPALEQPGHGHGVCQKLRRLECRSDITIGCVGLKSIHALVSLHQMDTLERHQLDHLGLVPRNRTGRVLVDKIAALGELLSVDPDHEIQVQLPLLDYCIYLCPVHLAKVHLGVPGAKGSARGRSYHKVGIMLVNVLLQAACLPSN